MNKTIRVALVGAAIVALASPVLARTAAKGDRMTGQYATNVGAWHRAPVSLRDRGPEEMQSAQGWYANAGYDRASSPFAGGVN